MFLNEPSKFYTEAGILDWEFAHGTWEGRPAVIAHHVRGGGAVRMTAAGVIGYRQTLPVPWEVLEALRLRLTIRQMNLPTND